MAYILGFLFADGNVIYTKRNTWFWSIQITDEDILVKIKKAIHSSHKISRKKRILNNKQLYRLQVGSREMCEDLMELGMTQRKSKTMLFPKIPTTYLPDFLRGYFDGDGGVWVGLKNKKNKDKIYTISTCFTSGSEHFLVSLKNIVVPCGILGGSLVKKERGFDLKYSVKDSLKLYNFMYNHNTKGSQGLYLKRKKRIFEKFKNLRS